MLTELDPRVAAHINLFAVLGALTVLPKRVPEAARLLEGLDRPVRLRFAVRGGPHGSYTVDSRGVHRGETAERGRTVTLAFASPEHFNRMVETDGKPIPLAGPAGLRFLTEVFAPLAEILGRYLRPSDADREDPAFRQVSTVLLLHVAVAAVAQVANEDRSGRFSAGQIPDGDVAVEVGSGLSLRLRVRDHRLAFDPVPSDSPARAALAFADLDVADAVLSGRTSALSCVCDGTLGMRGYVPMIDNVNRILDRVGHYLGK